MHAEYRPSPLRESYSWISSRVPARRSASRSCAPGLAVARSSRHQDGRQMEIPVAPSCRTLASMKDIKTESRSRLSA